MSDLLFINFFPIPLLVCCSYLALKVFLNRNKGVRYLINMVLFGLYLFEVINVLFFPFYVQSNWPDNITKNEVLRTLGDVNLSPLYFLSFSDRPFSLQWVLVDFGLNLLLTIPFGFGISYFKKPNFFRLCLWAVGAGLSLETLQLVLKLIFNNYHVVDINDVILNTMGVFIGALLYQVANWISKRLSDRSTTAVISSTNRDGKVTYIQNPD